ncbi:hypothetical protein F4802DRAFT_35647 [Xylaria palmicola]|nr:hypothetical protein F4802DRAFT_35647 [Xylaria palmicola]
MERNAPIPQTTCPTAARPRRRVRHLPMARLGPWERWPHLVTRSCGLPPFDPAAQRSSPDPVIRARQLSARVLVLPRARRWASSIPHSILIPHARALFNGAVSYQQLLPYTIPSPLLPTGEWARQDEAAYEVPPTTTTTDPVAMSPALKAISSSAFFRAATLTSAMGTQSSPPQSALAWALPFPLVSSPLEKKTDRARTAQRNTQSQPVSCLGRPQVP